MLLFPNSLAACVETVFAVAVLIAASIPVAHPCGASDAWTARRHDMVARQLEPRGITDPRVLDAMRRVPRHRFVPADEAESAYDDTPLPIGFGQTISQPFIVGYMSEALQLEPGHRVLEIGTGSGYQTAVLAELAGAVYSIEILPELAERARLTLQDLDYRNVRLRVGNGYLGWPEEAPFNRIIVTAAPPHMPQALVEQLAVGGRLVAPVGEAEQWMRIVTRTPERLIDQATIPVRFVPLVRQP